MNIKKLSIIKSDERGTIYNCDRMNFLVRKKGTISSDHTHKEGEDIFLVEGKIELTVGNETKEVEAPVKIKILPNVYHKIIALSDIRILYYYK
jgi:quercetin dioxygenase-like cupin family protein